MATNYQDYFAARIAGDLAAGSHVLAQDSKFLALQEASERKIAELEKIKQGQLADEARIGGSVFDTRSFSDVMGDVGVVALRGAVGLPEAFVGLADIPTGGRVGKFLDEEVGYRPGDAKEILSDLYSTSQKRANLNVEKVDGFGGTLEAALDNPSVIATAIGESIPQMLGGAAAARKLLSVGAKGVAIAAGGVGPALPGVLARTVGAKLAPVLAGAAGEGILGAGAAAAQIRGETEDGLLTDKQALSAVGTGVVTGAFGAAGGRLAQKLGLPDIDTMLASGNGVSTAGFVKAALGSGITEGVFEEMPQSAQEQMWQNYALGKPILDGVGKASAMGLLTGLAMGEVGGVGNSFAGAREQKEKEVVEVKATQSDAIKTGDVSALVDPTSKSFAPDQAIAALFGNSQLATTTPEAKQANLDKADKIIADLAIQREDLETLLDVATGARTGKLAQELAQYQAKLADPANAARAPQLQALIENAQAELADPGTPDPKAAKAYAAQIKKLDSQIELAKTNREQLGVLVQPANDIAADVGLATAVVADTDVEGLSKSKAAAERVVVLAMASPERLSPDAATQMAENASNGLTSQQRSYLRSFSAARIAENAARDLDKVSAEVFTGSKDNKGIAQYRRDMAAAVVAGSNKSAQKQLSGIIQFSDGHQDKAKAATDAKALFDTDGVNRRLENKGGKWTVEQGFWESDEARAKNGGLNIGKGATKLVAATVAEARALDAATAELRAVFDLKFNPTAGASNVKNTSQQSSATVSGQASPAVQATEEARTSGEGVGVGATTAAVTRSAATKPTPVKSSEENSVSSVKTVDTESTESTENTESTQLNEENQSTEDSTELVEPNPEDLAESVTDVNHVGEEVKVLVPEQSGALSVFTKQSQEGTSAGFERHFVQSAGAESSATLRPLVAVKNFLSQLSPASAKKYLKSGELTDKQRETLSFFKSTAMGWVKNITDNLAINKSPEYAFQNLSQLLFEQTEAGVDTDENVKSAISLAVFHYVAAAGSRGQFNGPEEINLILDRDENTKVSKAEIKALAGVGTRQNVVVASLGQSIVQALGIKAKKDAPLEMLTKLESALGAHAMKLMLDQGILTRTTMTGVEMKALTKNPNTDTNAKFQFLALNRDSDGALNPLAEQILEAIKGSQGVLEKMFSVEAGMKEPSFEPIPFVQKKAKNSTQDVPPVLAKVMEHENSVASYVRLDAFKLMGQLDRVISLQIAGGISEGADTAHKANRLANKAKNDGLMGEIDRAMSFFGGMFTDGSPDLTKPLYFEHSVWKQNRVGIATNVINPQTSKVHRHMLFRKSWETKVSRADAAQMENFRLRVAEGMGIKTDKQSMTSALSKLDAMLNNPVIVEAVKVLVKSMTQDSLTEADQEALLAGVKVGGENMHSLDALMALAHHDVAGPDGTFTVQMMGEVDGVTNGPMLSHLLMGAASTVSDLFDMLNRGGFYQQGQEDAQYNVWRSGKGRLDLYEQTAKSMMQGVQSRMLSEPALEGVMEALYSFTGKLEAEGSVTSKGRKIVKTPLTAMVFGSSTKKAVDSMAETFVEQVYESIETLAVEGGNPKTLIEAINALMDFGGGPRLPTSLSTAELMEREFNPAEMVALKKAFTETLGQSVKEALENDFAMFINQRRVFNETAQMAFEIYNSTYQALRDQKIEELMEAEAKEAGTGMPFALVKGKRIARLDLTAQQDGEIRQRLKAMAPVLHTAMSKESNALSSGLYLSKSGKKLSQDAAYQSDVKFGTVFGDTGAAGTKVNSYTREESNPGVAALVMSTHSADSAVMHGSIGDTEVLNVHDAKGVGLAGFKQAAQSLNESTFKVMLNYSPASEMMGTLSRTLMGLAELVQAGELPPTVAKNLAASIKTFAAKDKENPRDPVTVLRELVADTKAMANHADSIRLGALSQMSAIDQYALEGGNYTVSEADRQEAANRLAALTKESNPKLMEAVAQLEAFSQAELTGEVVAGLPADTDTVADIEQDQPLKDMAIVKVSVNEGARLLEQMSIDRSLPEPMRNQIEEVLAALLKGAKSVKAAMLDTLSSVDAAALAQAMGQRISKIKPEFWGQIGEPTVQSDPELVAFFENNPKPLAGEVIQFLHKKLKAQKPSIQRDFNIELLGQLFKTVPKDLPIQYVTPQTPESSVAFAPPTRARGYYANNGQGIFIMSPDFKHSGVGVEVLMHELIHAALVAAVQYPTAQTKDLVEELHNLRTKAIDFANANGLLGKYVSALENLDEFLAWGMTNRKFQREVLSKVTMQSKTKKNTLVSGMKEFMRVITAIMFRGSDKSTQAKTVNGMSVLMSNVSGLFADVATSAKAAAESARVLSMEADPVGLLNTYSTQDLFEALDDGSVSSGFQDQLKGLLGGIVHKLHGAYGSLHADLMKNQALTPMDVWLKAQATGKAPFASKALVSGFTISEQEAFVIEQVEATVRASLDGNETQTSMVYAELSKLFMEVRAKLKPADFAAVTNGDAAAAQELHDFVFALNKSNGDKMDHLSRFAAMGLAHEGFNKLLDLATGKDPRKASSAKSIGQRLQIMFENILSYFTTRKTATFYGQKGNRKLALLVDQLVDIEAKRRNILAAPADRSLTAGTETKVRESLEALRVKVGNLANSQWVNTHKRGFVRGAGGVVRTLANERVERFMDVISEVRDANQKGRPGLMAGVLNSVRGPLAVFENLLSMAKSNEHTRKDIITAAAKASLQAFAENGKGFAGKAGKDAKAAVSAVFMRTGAHALMGVMTMAELEGILGDKAKLNAAIAATESRLNVQPNVKAYVINQAIHLGYFKATGKNRSPMAMMNAYNIAKMFGTNGKDKITEAQSAEMVPTIEQLVALHALAYSKAKHISAAKEILRVENQRAGGENGVTFVLGAHRQLEKESMDRLFGGNKTLAMHGYTAEIYSPHIEAKVANEMEGKDLEYQGYVKGGQVVADVSDPDAEVMHVYTLKGAGLQPYLSGAMSYTGTNAKGKTRHNGNLSQNSAQGLENSALMANVTFASERQAAIKNLFNPGTRADPTKMVGNRMAPVLNAAGDVVNWRYMMSEDNKDTLLKRNNAFDQVMGTIAGSIFDKSTALEQNTEVVKAMKEQYDSEFATASFSYMKIGPVSSDPEMREIWRMMTPETQKMIQDVWGEAGLMVRKDSLDLLFGYRKLSLANAFKKEPALRNQLEKVFVEVVELGFEAVSRVEGNDRKEAKLMAKRAAAAITRGERVWMEIIKETKDIIVVKTGVVLLGNIWSNMSQLWVNGVPIKDMVHHHLVALKGATAYRKDSEALSQLKIKLDSGYTLGDEAEMRARVLLLEDSLARNPVKELIDRGLMPSIVEDLAADEDTYSYKTALVEATESTLNRLNPTVLAIGRQIYMTHDTAMYQGLSRATQLSDFVARYTLYQHLTNRKENPLSKDQARIDARDAFVNYDNPLHRGLQWTDDMGLTMFTKYFLYIQRVIQKQMRDNPARMLTLAALSNFVNLGPIVLNSMALARIGNNPLENGVLKFPQSLDDLATVNFATGLFK